MPKLTKRFIESINADSEKALKFWDSELKGFGVVVLPSGRKTYCIQYRNQQRVLKRLKVGVHGTISSEQARDIAKKQLASLAHGKDPADTRSAQSKLATLADLTKEYLATHACHKRAKSQEEDDLMLNRYILPSLGELSVKHISTHEIQKMHVSLKKTPYRANRILSLLSKMFTLAVSWGWRDDNPVKGIQKYQEEKRERWLNKEELERLWESLEKHPHHLTSYLFKLLILTGSRKGEVMNATWDQFNLEQGVWVKPSHLTKQKRMEHLPLSAKAVNVLRQVEALNTTESPYLFPGRIEGQPIKEVKTFWKTLLKNAKLENVRIHDLRHTHASHLVSSGLSLSIVEKLLGHTQASTTQRYAHLSDGSLREAAELFGTKVG